MAHEILQQWHEADSKVPIAEVMDRVFEARNVHPLMRGLWQPRLQQALEWVEHEITHADGKIDRLDRFADGTLGIVDYKTGSPPSSKMVEQGFALQLGLLGMMAGESGFGGVKGEASAFEYWSLAKAKPDTNPFGFGYVETPLKIGSKRTGIEPEDFLPETETYLTDAITRWIKGDDPFTARFNPDYPAYDTYDQLMRLEEWLPHMDVEEDET